MKFVKSKNTKMLQIKLKLINYKIDISISNTEN